MHESLKGRFTETKRAHIFLLIHKKNPSWLDMRKFKEHSMTFTWCKIFQTYCYLLSVASLQRRSTWRWEILTWDQVSFRLFNTCRCLNVCDNASYSKGSFKIKKLLPLLNRNKMSSPGSTSAFSKRGLKRQELLHTINVYCCWYTLPDFLSLL